MRDSVYSCAKAKCVYRKLNVANYQCKYKGKYTLNVNISSNAIGQAFF